MGKPAVITWYLGVRGSRCQCPSLAGVGECGLSQGNAEDSGRGHPLTIIESFRQTGKIRRRRLTKGPLVCLGVVALL